MPRPVRVRRALALLTVVAVALAACSTGASPSPSTASGSTSIPVQLQEWAVVPASTSAAAGAITFQIKNTGPDDAHEFVVIRTDLEPGALPIDGDGAVIEDGLDVVDEVEEIAVGAAAELAVTLTPGKYVFLCNIYEAANNEAHYRLGMRVAFTVTS